MLGMLFPFVLCSQTVQTSPGVKALKDGIETLNKDAGLKHAAWGVCVQVAADGKTLAEYNSEMSLMPASTMKVATTAAALSILGSNFTFDTEIEYSGTIDSAGTLHGDLFITGGGDPTIGSKRFGDACMIDSVFGSFYSAMKAAQISAVDGRLVCDASIFDYNPAVPEWSWEDVGNYYAAGACGLNIRENFYRIYFNAGKNIGDSASVSRMEPEMPGLEFHNFVTTGKAGSGDNVIIYGSPFTSLRIMEGTVPLGKKDFDVDGAIPDPPQYFIERFNNYLANKGIKISKGLLNVRNETWHGNTDTNARKTLMIIKSPPLEKIVRFTNLNSINVFAECMVKMIGLKKGGDGSTSEGVSQITNYWKGKGIDTDGFDMKDGCGLARKNKVTCKQFCAMLRVIKKEKIFDAFGKSLPEAGKSGGIAGLFKGTVAENNLKAKTGTMNGIRAYTGYVKNKAGTELVFSIMVNNYTCSAYEMKQKLEDLMILIAQTD
jgi:D-alanyl-D-alanine carboxypeptidase/D-alanyl-D-alanine-endopeptidase (penicillin-binding protein 4)